jgi:predicted nuclease of predicted toxin-antitoxin system
MRFLTDENIARSIVGLLREAGHDVLSAKESTKGAADRDILARAVVEARILVTFDKDFGELAFRSRLPSGCGVVLFRMTWRGREKEVERVLHTLQGRDDWNGAFWTVTDQRIRRRPLPQASP